MPVETVTMSFRAERDFVERLEAVLEQMKREVPGARLKLSDAIRATLLEGLRVRERSRRKTKR
jgi:predicted transcriptional regulator